jgi:hypothetical protein
MSVEIVKGSRLDYCDLPVIDGVEFWDLTEMPQPRENPDDIIYQVQSLDRLDRLAARFYNNPVLWWVIALANGMEAIPTALIEGDTIRIPSPRYVFQELVGR